MRIYMEFDFVYNADLQENRVFCNADLQEKELFLLRICESHR